MPQTSVGAPAIGQEGTFATAANRGTTSYVAAESMVVGTLAVLTTGALTCEQPDLTGDVTGLEVLGIVMLDENRTTMTYAAGEHVPIASDGEVYVLTESACTAGAAPFVRFADPSAPPFELGSFRHDADTADAVALPNAVWKTSAGAGELAIVKFFVGRGN